MINNSDQRVYHEIDPFAYYDLMSLQVHLRDAQSYIQFLLARIASTERSQLQKAADTRSLLARKHPYIQVSFSPEPIESLFSSIVHNPTTAVKILPCCVCGHISEQMVYQYQGGLSLWYCGSHPGF